MQCGQNHLATLLIKYLHVYYQLKKIIVKYSFCIYKNYNLHFVKFILYFSVIVLKIMLICKDYGHICNIKMDRTRVFAYKLFWRGCHFCGTRKIMTLVWVCQQCHIKGHLRCFQKVNI